MVVFFFRYVDCAKQAKIPARCFVVDVPYEHALHNNKVNLPLYVLAADPQQVKKFGSL